MDEKVKTDGAVPPGEQVTPSEAMRLAIAEGHKGRGFVFPNPLVGCAIVDRKGRLLSLGYHRQVGGDHAEIDAIKKVQDSSRLKGADFFVSLEPCAHRGRTPSCAEALAKLRPASVTYALEDPNPLVSGRGAEILRQAQVRVFGIGERDDVSSQEKQILLGRAEDLAEVFLHNMRTKEPFVGVKVATSLDGAMALKSGVSKWITGESARHHVHLLRAGYEAVGVGARTFLLDNPSLNIRHKDFPDKQNLAVIFDPQGESFSKLKGSTVLKLRPPESVLVVVNEKTSTSLLSSLGVRFLSVPVDERGLFDMKELMARLMDLHIGSILIEGGSHTVGSFFSNLKVQRLHLFLAPSLLGLQSAVSWSAHFGVESLENRINIERPQWQIFDPDFYLTGRVRFDGGSMKCFQSA